MAWITVPGLAGKVYAPEDDGQHCKKHPCSACYSCQWCDETRCQVCRSSGDDREIKEQGCWKQKKPVKPIIKIQSPNHK